MIPDLLCTQTRFSVWSMSLIPFCFDCMLPSILEYRNLYHYLLQQYLNNPLQKNMLMAWFFDNLKKYPPVGIAILFVQECRFAQMCLWVWSPIFREVPLFRYMKNRYFHGLHYQRLVFDF